MDAHSVRVCAEHPNATKDARQTFDKLPGASVTGDRFCLELPVEASSPGEAMTRGMDRFINDAFDAGLFGPNAPLDVRVTYLG
jgi:hypothetical protein